MINVRTWAPLSVTYRTFSTAEQVADYIDGLVEAYENDFNEIVKAYNKKIEINKDKYSYNISMLRRELSLDSEEIMSMVTIYPVIKKRSHNK